MKPEKLNIVLADEQVFFREGFKTLMKDQSFVNIVAEYSNDGDVCKSLKDKVFDIVIIDYFGDSNFTIEDINRLKKCYPDKKFVVISSDKEKSSISKVIALGVDSYLTKECNKPEIIEALYAVMRGEKFFCNKVIDIINELKESENCESVVISDREMEIIQLIAKGFTNKQIADKLFRSTHTIHTHRKNIMKKLGVSSAVELTRYAIAKD